MAFAPAIDGAIFPGTPSANFWSSTPVLDTSQGSSSLYVDWAEGGTNYNGPWGSLERVPCVRGQ